MIAPLHSRPCRHCDHGEAVHWTATPAADGGVGMIGRARLCTVRHGQRSEGRNGSQGCNCPGYEPLEVAA